MPRKNRQRRRTQAILPTSNEYPSAQTFYRVSLLTEGGRELFQRTSAQMTDEMVLSRDGPAIEKIKAAHTPAELLDLIPISTGLAQAAWLEQMRLLKLGAAPLIAERLVASAAIEDASARTLVEERLVAALYLCGGLGADHLFRCFDSLSLYGQSLACLALGRAQAQQAADRIWAYYERVKNYTLDRFLVGPLWALADLKDPRAGSALAELLETGRDFYELPGLAALAGDREAVMPLFWRFAGAPKGAKDDYVYALAAVGHRIGRAALREEFEKGLPEKSRAALPDKAVEAFSRFSPEDVEEHFSLFYE